MALVFYTITAKPSRWWVERVKMSVPHSYTLPAISWYYPDGAPENVTADVKHYVHVAGEYAPEDSYGWSGKYTMENP